MELSIRGSAPTPDQQEVLNKANVYAIEHGISIEKALDEMNKAALTGLGVLLADLKTGSTCD